MGVHYHNNYRRTKENDTNVSEAGRVEGSIAKASKGAAVASLLQALGNTGYGVLHPPSYRPGTIIRDSSIFFSCSLRCISWICRIISDRAFCMASGKTS